MAIKKKLTPEQQAGKDFIKEREKRASEIMQEGNRSAAGAQRQATKEIGTDTRNKEDAKLIERGIDRDIKEEQKTKESVTMPGQNLISPGKEAVSTDKQFLIDNKDKPGAINKINMFGAKIGAGSLVDERNKAIESIAKPVAETIYFLRTLGSTKKPLDVTTAEGAFNDAISALDRDVKDVKAGLKSPIEAKTNMDLAKSALGRLETSQKQKGQANLYYWKGGGKEIEAEIIIFRQRMKDLQRDLMLAEEEFKAIERQNRINQALMAQGLQ